MRHLSLAAFAVPVAVLLAHGGAGRALAQQNPAGLARPGTCRATDALDPLPLRGVVVGGLLGDRIVANERARLPLVDEGELLAGFRRHPGKQAWIGEHVGKWLHAASLAEERTGDPALLAKLRRVAAGLMATQEPDGYLGTYVVGRRFGLYPDADWDVWIHKYDLIGLLSYYQCTGDTRALDASRRIGDLLIATFGPGGRSINTAGTHMGMASTSVLEPIVLLYRATADPRYLEFARRIVEAWDEPQGAHVVTALRRYRTVTRVANGKAYEMLSDLCGLCELYRATGERRYIDPVLTAWDDIVRHRLYITGSASAGEHWQADGHLPNGANASICETCVTVTWEQLNLQLLRLTGEGRFADQLERTVYNHLLGAQKPTGDSWCYYTPLEGRKPYGTATSCCLSSGPRGVELIPTFIYGSAPDGIYVNLYARSSASVPLGQGEVRISQETAYPLAGTVEIAVYPKGAPLARTFALRLRLPAWTPAASVTVNGTPMRSLPRQAGYLVIRRAWQAGDRAVLRLRMPPHLVLGDGSNQGRACITVGPLVLAADGAHNPGVLTITRVALASDDVERPAVRPAGHGRSGELVFEVDGSTGARPAGTGKQTVIRLVPFYAAGADGSPVCAWLRRPGLRPSPGASLLSDGEESCSRAGNVPGSIIDGDRATFCVTFDGTAQAEDWYAVALSEPTAIDRVVFAHGRIFHDGGWFDTSTGKPRVQVQTAPGSPWRDVAVLDGYPSATATAPPPLQDGQAFEVSFAPITVLAVRVVGKPACGDNPAQAFSSCAELQAYRRP